jgi:hypothetical protein
MSRPKKERNPITDNRTPKAGPPDLRFREGKMNDDDMAFSKRYVAVWNATLDPMNEFPELLPIFGPVIVGSAGEVEKRELADFVERMVCEVSQDEAERVFGQILKMKRNMMQRDRRAYALMAYSHYFDEAGKEPTKPQLKAYMQARRDIYKDQPGPDEPWTRLWKETGLFGMADR